MIPEFYDSSTFAKLFLFEKGTKETVERYLRPGRRIVSRLAFIEVRSALQRLVTNRLLLPGDAVIARSKLDAEVGHAEIVALDEPVLLLAHAILDRRPLRTLDAIQLASALSISQHEPILFVSSDTKLSAAAGAEGLHVIDPTIP